MKRATFINFKKKVLLTEDDILCDNELFEQSDWEELDPELPDHRQQHLNNPSVKNSTRRPNEPLQQK